MSKPNSDKRASVQSIVRRPSGFVAKCQCGVDTGALDISRTSRDELGNIVGQWLWDGKTIEPRFDGSWDILLSSCRCRVGNDS